MLKLCFAEDACLFQGFARCTSWKGWKPFSRCELWKTLVCVMFMFANVIQSWIGKEYTLSVTFAHWQATMKVSLRVAQATFFWRLLKEGTAIVKKTSSRQLLCRTRPLAHWSVGFDPKLGLGVVLSLSQGLGPKLWGANPNFRSRI